MAGAMFQCFPFSVLTNTLCLCYTANEYFAICYDQPFLCSCVIQLPL